MGLRETRRVAVVLLVALAVSLLAVPPAFATPHDGTTGIDVGDALTGGSDSTSTTNSSDGGSTDDSTADNSTNTSTEPTDDTTTDESSFDDSSADDGSTGDSSADDGSTDDSTTDDGSSTDGSTADSTDDGGVLNASADAVNGTVDRTTEIANDTTATVTDGESILTATSLDEAGSGTLSRTLESLGADGDTLLSDDTTLGGTVDDVTTTLGITVVYGPDPAPAAFDDSNRGPPPTDASEADEPRQIYESTAGIGVPDGSVADANPQQGDAGTTPLPGDAGAGVALGLGALAIGAILRQSGLLAGSGAMLAASASPITSRGASAFERLVRLFSPLRYSRYDDSDPLEHDARADVYAVVEETPGAYLSELAKRADLPLSTTRHHVRVLVREDLLTGAKVRGKRRFYPAYTEGIELAAAMNDDATASILDALARLGAASVSDLAAELERDPSTISHHLQRLEEHELIVREREGRAVMNRVAPEVRAAVEPEPEPVSGPGEAVAGGAD